MKKQASDLGAFKVGGAVVIGKMAPTNGAKKKDMSLVKSPYPWITFLLRLYLHIVHLCRIVLKIHLQLIGWSFHI